MSGAEVGVAAEAEIASITRVDGLLRRLPAYLMPALRQAEGGGRYFGSGDAGENCIRSMSSICFAMAVLTERLDDQSGRGWEEERTILLEMLAYLCGCHRTGGGRSVRGKRWGLEWQSSWWAAKLALAADIARERLDPDLWALVEGVVVAEADRHLTRDAPTGLFRDTKAEEIAWDAEILAAAVSMYPEHANAGAWRDKLIEFLANTFSTPQDRSSDATIDGVPVRHLVYTCNIHSDSTLENHGSYHFCYVASPLLSKSFVHYALRAGGVTTPEALDHNVAGVWDLASRTFLKRRFAYISGQDWARYTYGEYFILPALIWLARSGRGAEASRIFAARLATLEDEASWNDDGSFFGRRLTGGNYEGQLGKYETDCFACVALARMLLEHELPATPEVGHGQSTPFIHVSPESQTCFHRSERGFFSFSWSTLETPWPMLLMVPDEDDSLAEWNPGNGIVSVTLRDLSERVGVGSIRATERGIVADGRHFIRGRNKSRVLEHSCRVEYNAEAGQARVASEVWLKRRVWLTRTEGLAFCVPNDIFNGCRRRYVTDQGEYELVFKERPSRASESPFLKRCRRAAAKVGVDGSRLVMDESRWMNVDDRLGFVPLDGQRLRLRVSAERNSSWGSLHYDTVVVEGPRVRFRPRAGCVLSESRMIIHFGTAVETRSLYERSRATPSGDGEDRGVADGSP